MNFSNPRLFYPLVIMLIGQFYHIHALIWIGAWLVLVAACTGKDDDDDNF